MKDKEKLAKALAENEALKAKLGEFRQLEEDLMADKVFKKAKDKLVGWYTVGGITIFIVSIIGIKSVVDYSKELVTKKMESVSEDQINEIIHNESERQIATLIERQEDSLTQNFQEFYQQKKEEFIIATNPLKGGDLRDSVSRSTDVNIPTIKSAIDLSKFTSSPRDQGNEASTVGFTVAAALEIMLAQKYGRSITISPRYIYNNINHGSNYGATFHDAFTLLVDPGAVTEAAWPYKPGEYASKPPSGIDDATHYSISSWSKLDVSPKLFKSILAKGTPIVAGVMVYGSWIDNNKSGLYSIPTKTESPRGGQGICIVGYDDNKQLFKFSNSWGTDWGDKGYGYIRYGDLKIAIYEAYSMKL